MNNKFFFGKKQEDELMSKINFREINSYAKEWRHPIHGFLQVFEDFKESGKDILKTSKKNKRKKLSDVV